MESGRGGNRDGIRGAKDTAKKWACDLLVEEVLEGLAGVVVARRGRRGGVSSLLRVGGGRGVFFHGGTKFVEGAVVLGVLGRDALWDRLRALKLRGAVEVEALFATVQLESAFGTLAVGVKATGEHCAAIGAAGTGHGADHARRSRAELVGARTALRRLAVMRAFLFVLLFRVAITAVTILSIHKRLRTPKCARQFARKSRASGAWTGPVCHRQAACGRQAKARPYNATDLYPIGLLHSTVNAIFPRVYRTGLPTVRPGDGTPIFLVLWQFECNPGTQRRSEHVSG